MATLLNLVVHDVSYMMVCLPATAERPALASGKFNLIVEAREGFTLIGEEADVSAGAKATRGLRCIEIVEDSDLESVGVLASVVCPLAEAGISLFAHSTWATDYIFLKQDSLAAAVDALRRHGHVVQLHEDTLGSASK
jgi:hypothetical protein